jgi:hypothetical protein
VRITVAGGLAMVVVVAVVVVVGELFTLVCGGGDIFELLLELVK